jgi:hypothetical protein
MLYKGIMKFRQNGLFIPVSVLILITFSTFYGHRAPSPPSSAGGKPRTHPGRRQPGRPFRATEVRFFFATGFALMLACAPGRPYAAQGTQHQSWTVATGKMAVLAEYYEIQESGCRALRAPPVVIKARPALGKLVVNTTTALADKTSRCRHVKVPVTRVLYHAGSQPGRDAFAWEIFFQSRELGTRSVQGAVTVTPGTPGR